MFFDRLTAGAAIALVARWSAVFRVIAARAHTPIFSYFSASDGRMDAVSVLDFNPQLIQAFIWDRR